MSKYIRKARHQLHNVRDDVVKKQLQAVKDEIRQKNPRHSREIPSDDGFKFRDIETMNIEYDDNWIDNEPTIVTKDDDPSLSADLDDDKIQSNIDTIWDDMNESVDPLGVIDQTPPNLSLFDNGPNLNEEPEIDENYFGPVSTEYLNEFQDPLGLSPYARTNSESPLFENELDNDIISGDPIELTTETDDPITQSTNDILTITTPIRPEPLQVTGDIPADGLDREDTELTDNLFQQSVDKFTVPHDSPNKMEETNDLTESVQSHAVESVQSSLPEVVAPQYQPDEELHEDREIENLTHDDDDDLFQSAKPDLFDIYKNSPEIQIEDEADPIVTTTKTMASSPEVLDTQDHPLLHLEDDYMSDYYSHDVSVTHNSTSSHIRVPNGTTHCNTLIPEWSNSSPENPSPLSSSPPINENMRLNRSGKLVPVVPPRPSPPTKQLPSYQRDPDTISIASSLSTTSSVFIHDSSSLYENSLSSVPSLNDSTSDLASPLSQEVLPPVIKEQDLIKVTAAVSNETEDDYTFLLLSFFALLLYLYYSLNPFAYLAGFLAGFLVFYVIIGSAFVLYVQHSEREKERRKATASHVTSLPLLDELPLTIMVDFESNRELKSKLFGLVHQYHPTSHHPSQRLAAKVRLYDDYQLEIRYKKTVQTHHEGTVTREEVLTKDLRQCSVLIVPEEVAQNRKRRWSKKFPLSISWLSDEDKGRVFLFPNTSREKEEWFRRLRSASEGKTYDELVQTCEIYYRYMGKYMPTAIAAPSSHSSTSSSVTFQQQTSTRHHRRAVHNRHTTSHHRQETTSVRFSMASTSESTTELEDQSVSIDQQKTPAPASDNMLPQLKTINDITSISSQSNHRNNHVSQASTVPKKYVPDSLPLNLAIGWINAGLARLAWDLWHEERWKKWVTSRIQRKLIRIKTPSFMETLKVTEVNMGMDMPVIKRPFKLPRLNQQGMWIYLEVEYNGSFTMTIETKLKLEPKGIGEVLHFNTGDSSPPLSHSPSPSPTQHLSDLAHTVSHKHRHHLPRIKVNTGDEEDEISSGSDDDSGNSSLTHSMEEKLPDELEAQGIVLKDDSPHTTNPASSHISATPTEHDVTMGPQGRKEKLLTNMVSRLQKFAVKSRFVARAAEKFSSYPLTLQVEVKHLDGLLVLNMAPPPSDAIWFGFQESPKLELVAKPKLGQREVTLSYVTDWIEKKLCEVVEKKLVLPNMEDLVIPILNSGLPEDKLKDTFMSP